MLFKILFIYVIVSPSSPDISWPNGRLQYWSNASVTETFSGLVGGLVPSAGGLNIDSNEISVPEGGWILLL